MKYTTKQRKAIHAALVAAKPYLWDGISSPGLKSPYICHTIKKAAADHTDGGYKARQMITGRIDNHTVATWLRDIAKVPVHELTYKNVQAYRHRWLDALIEEFSQ